MNKFLDKLEKILLPVASKLNGQRHLASLRDGFIAIMPLMLIGAFAVMINSVFLNFAEGSLFQTVFNFEPIKDADLPSFIQYLKQTLNVVGIGTFSISALAVAFTIAYSLTEIKGYRGLEAGVLAVSAFVITFSFDSIAEMEGFIDGSYVNFAYFGAANIITAIIVALISAEIYTALLKRNVRIKMPEGVPPAVERSFSALIPAAVIILVFAFLQTAIVNLGDAISESYTGDFEFLINAGDINSLSQFIQQIIGVPLKAVAGGAAGLYVYVTGVDLLWFFGIHGPNTLAFLDQGVFTPAALENGDLINSGVISYYATDATIGMGNVYTKSLVDSFVFIGGSGATIGLVIALLIGSTVDSTRKIAKYALAPALFNINEPLLFGLPVVFNPVLFIPFLIVQPILLTIVLVAMKILPFLPDFAIPIPWTSPPILGAFLAYGGSIWMALLALVCVVVSTIVYLPFVIVMNRIKEDDGINEAELKEG